MRVKAENEKGKGGATVAGKGDIVDWKKMFNIAETVGGIEWRVVEQEDCRQGSNLMEACAECFENLKKMGKV